MENTVCRQARADLVGLGAVTSNPEKEGWPSLATQLPQGNHVAVATEEDRLPKLTTQGVTQRDARVTHCWTSPSEWKPRPARPNPKRSAHSRNRSWLLGLTTLPFWARSHWCMSISRSRSAMTPESTSRPSQKTPRQRAPYVASISSLSWTCQQQRSAETSSVGKRRQEVPSRCPSGTRGVSNPNTVGAMTNRQTDLVQFQQAQLNSAVPEARQRCSLIAARRLSRGPRRQIAWLYSGSRRSFGRSTEFMSCPMSSSRPWYLWFSTHAGHVAG